MGPRARIVQVFGSFTLGIIIGGIIAYIGNTELVHFIRPLAILFFAGIAVLVASFLYLDAWRRKQLNSTLSNLRTFVVDNKDDLVEALKLLQAKRMDESLSKLPRPKREHFDALSRLIQVYAGMLTASSLINVSIASAAALLAAAMVSEQNKLIKSQNYLIDLQHRLERNRARASAIEYVDRRYYLFRANEKDYPPSDRRAALHYFQFPPREQAALRKYWSLVYAQWLTLGGDTKYLHREAPEPTNGKQGPDFTPSYSVWTDYLVPIVQETGRQQALVEALCVSIQEQRWPADRPVFVDSLLTAMEPGAGPTFNACCQRSKGGDHDAVAACSRPLVRRPPPSREHRAPDVATPVVGDAKP